MANQALRMLNVKVTDDLRALITRATELSGMRSMSEWMREALEAGARQEIAGHERLNGQQMTTALVSDVATRSLGMEGPYVQCVHPTTARRQTVEAEICSLCGTVMRWKV